MRYLILYASALRRSECTTFSVRDRFGEIENDLPAKILLADSFFNLESGWRDSDPQPPAPEAEALYQNWCPLLQALAGSHGAFGQKFVGAAIFAAT